MNQLTLALLLGSAQAMKVESKTSTCATGGTCKELSCDFSYERVLKGSHDYTPGTQYQDKEFVAGDGALFWDKWARS